MSDNLPSGVANSEIQSRVLEEVCSKLISGIDGASLLHIIRKIVKKEVEQQLKDLINGKYYSGADSSLGSRNLELQFSCNVSEMIWTAESIKGEGNNPILISLFDSGKVVKFEPVASAKVEVVILKESFDSDDWTTEEFNQNIIREMNGKNILKGNAFLELKDGIGALGDLSIVHNQTWKPVSMLRLGARFVNSFPNIKVKEAKTKTFTMKDKRMKVKLLSLMDKVWCLKHIGKCKPVVDRLTEEGIQTIEDFLKLYFLHPKDLRGILGHGWTERKMKATIDQALKCKGSMTLKRDALNLVKSPFDNKEEGVVWDDTVQPLVSPTFGSSNNGPFSSPPSMMGENVGAEAMVGSSFVSNEVSNGHDPTTGNIVSSYEHWDAIGDQRNDPNNILQVRDIFMDHTDEFNSNDNNMLFRVPSLIYENDQLWQFDDLEN